MRGCCCEACIEAPRLLRPAKTVGSYGRAAEYFDAQQLAKLREVGLDAQQQLSRTLLTVADARHFNMQ